MFVPIANVPRPYAWGSTTAISGLLGREASGGPEAELWYGAHDGSPSSVQGSGLDLAEWIARDPDAALGSWAPRLPFLLKVLAAGSPLSLQAHPTAEQAREGFERENAAGVPLDAPHRNYRDPYPKPEILYALSERFEALCGFRPVEETLAVIRSLDASGALDVLSTRIERRPLSETFEWLLTRGDGVDDLVERVTALAASAEGVAASTVRMLADQYPGDPGIVVSLLLNRVTLKRGEVLYLPAGNIHAYLEGLGIELMTASDNVLRGGLTPKHVDVPELLSVLDFTTGPVPYLAAAASSAERQTFAPEGVDLVLVRVSGDSEHELTGPAIALCTAGGFELAGGATSARLERGDAVFITSDERALRVSGSGELFLATTP